MEVDFDLEETGEKVAVGSGALTVVAAFLPWLSIGIASAAGVDTDGGVVTLLFGAATIGVIALREWERLERIAIGVLGLLTVGIAALMYANLADASGPITVGAGIGLHLTLLGGVGMAVAAVLDRFR